jgi:hypothetical protein
MNLENATGLHLDPADTVQFFNLTGAPHNKIKVNPSRPDQSRTAEDFSSESFNAVGGKRRTARPARRVRSPAAVKVMATLCC